jgi:hypothetical protein
MWIVISDSTVVDITEFDTLEKTTTADEVKLISLSHTMPNTCISSNPGQARGSKQLVIDPQNKYIGEGYVSHL